MDEKLEKALAAANHRLNLLNLKENLKIKFDTIVTYATNGGIFKATRELIVFVKIIIDSNRSTVVLIDENGNPIEITDIPNFYENLLDKYFQATNYYHYEYTKLKKIRSSAELFSELTKEDNQ